MKIVNLKWLSQQAKEAELIVSDGVHECLVFSQPCQVQQNEIYSETLHAMDVENLMKVLDESASEKIVKTNEDYFSHYCVARVLKMEEAIVAIGEILIELDVPIPSWANEGDLVEFKCGRLDIW